MAKSALRIRFVLNAQGGRSFERESRQRFINNFGQVVLENVAFRYSDEVYRKLASRLEDQLVRDARRELTHMATLFRNHITGALKDSPSGKLKAINQTGRYGGAISIKASLPKWAPRNKQYVKYKQAQTGSRNWFTARGLTDKKDAMYSGLKSNTNREAWIAMFGPIKASFTRSNKATSTANAASKTKVGTGLQFFPVQPEKNHIKIAVGTIKVYALTKLTPEMIPALLNGDAETMNSDKGNPGLIGLVQNVDEQMAYRLGRRSGKEDGRRYRPTLEPFLAYFLTEALPAAIGARMKANQMDWSRNAAGRTSGKKA